jgi:hypothetical protein
VSLPLFGLSFDKGFFGEQSEMTDKHLIAICIVSSAVVFSTGHDGSLFLIVAAVSWLFN